MCRGRWKSKKRTSDDYDDIELPFVDAKVAKELCIGGAVKYKVRKKESISNTDCSKFSNFFTFFI